MEAVWEGKAVLFRSILTVMVIMVPCASTIAGVGQFQDSTVLGGLGLNNAVAMRFAPDGRIFVAERNGLIKVFDHINDATATVTANLNSEVYNAWDRGLLGLAIHPNFPTTPYIYVLYTRDATLGGSAPLWNDQCPDPPGFTNEGCLVSSRLSRLEIAGDVMTGGEQVLLDAWCQQYPSHSVGDLHFGADGALYVTHGDGASFNFEDFGQVLNPCGDPPFEGGALRSQDLATAGDPVGYDGTVLRLDDAGLPLPSNPLFGGATDDDAVIAYGLRNPFRCAMRPGTSELWIGDVGWGAWEEINRLPDPIDAVIDNFGWPCYEGPNTQAGYDSINLAVCEALYAAGTATSPYHAYLNDSPTGSSISGLAFYTGGRFPDTYDDALFYGDFSARWIRVMLAGGSGLPDPATDSLFLDDVSPVDLQMGPDGNLYYLAYDHSGPTFLHQVTYDSGNLSPVALVTADQTSGPVPLTVQFDGSTSFDPDGSIDSYAWDLDGDGAFDDGTGPTAQNIYTTGGTVSVGLRVTDNESETNTKHIVITVDNSAPLPTIISPLDSLAWRVGDLIDLEGSAVDPEDGVLAGEQLDWEVILHHCVDGGGGGPPPPIRPDDAVTVEAQRAPQHAGHDHRGELIRRPREVRPRHVHGGPGCHEHFLVAFDDVAEASMAAIDHEYPSFLEVRLTATDHGQPNWWDSAWPFRQPLHIDNGAQIEDLLFFPVLIRLHAGRIDYADVAADGADLRFIDAGGSMMPHEIESWDPGGDSLVWVGVPFIGGGSSTGIWMYYGNASAPDAQDATSVWSNGTAAAWHLNDPVGASPTPVGPAGTLQNGGFESGLDSWGVVGNAFAEGGATRSGSLGLKMFGQFNGGFNYSLVWQDVPAATGEIWQLDAWMRTPDGDAIVGTPNAAEMVLEFRDAGGIITASGKTVAWTGSPLDDWLDPNPITWVAPTGTTIARALLLFRQPALDSGAVFYDDITLNRIATNGQLTVLDSAADHDGFNDNTTLTSGLLANGRSFDGSSSIDFGNRSAFEITGAMTIEAWIQVANPNADVFARILSKKNAWNGTGGYELEYNPEQNFLTILGSGGDFGRAEGVDLDTGWHYVAATIAGDQAALFVDGVDVTTDSTISPLMESNQALVIGRTSSGHSHFTGGIDEVRVSSVARSADWIAAQFQSMSDASVTYGTRENFATLSTTTTVMLDPIAHMLDLLTDPPGLQVSAYGLAEPAPTSHTVIAGANLVVSATTPQVVEGTTYNFSGWSNGQPASHNLIMPDNNLVLTATFTAECTESSCADVDTNGVRDDGCLWTACETTCATTAIIFGDAGGSFGACPPDGFANIHDRNHVLTCFENSNPCNPFNIDVGGAFGVCAPDGFCNVHDANHTMAAFAGTNSCSCPTGPAPIAPPQPSDHGRIRLIPEFSNAGGIITVHAMIEGPRALQAYQLHATSYGGPRGHLQLIDIDISDRADAVFADESDSYEAVNIATSQVLAGISGSSEVQQRAYLATLTYRASPDADGRFVIDLLTNETAGDQTFLIGPAANRIALTVDPAVIEVTPHRRLR
jgi:glucose/arabinose dehydrogenase